MTDAAMTDAAMSAAPARQLIYVADPMCSWCWGFAPVMHEVVARYQERVALHLFVGGLRAYNTTPMDDAQKTYIREHWGHVAERTGQPFDHAFFDREGFVYDTEPACRAVVSVRKLDGARTLAMLSAVEQAFYAENRDVTDADVLGDVAAGIGVERAAFMEMHASDTTKADTRQDFQFARQLGVQGFPTLLASENEALLGAVTRGYESFDGLRAYLDSWLEVEGEAA